MTIDKDYNTCFDKPYDEILDKLKQIPNEYRHEEYNEAIRDVVRFIERYKEEYNNGWIPCSERLPEERDSMFAKLKGTDKWSDHMFEKISDDVNATVEFEDGTRKTMTLHTNDGKWNTNNRIVKCNVIAWQPLPEPYKER